MKTNRHSNFVGDFIVKFNQRNPLVPPGNLYYIAGSFGNPEIVKVVLDQEVFDCPDLYSTQDEADTRMILQALHADKKLKELGKQGRIIIKTSDTDVIVLYIYFDKQMTNTSELWVQMGNISSAKDGRRFFPIHELCSSLSQR
jgi:hypothetical protein